MLLGFVIFSKYFSTFLVHTNTYLVELQGYSRKFFKISLRLTAPMQKIHLLCTVQ